MKKIIASMLALALMMIPFHVYAMTWEEIPGVIVEVTGYRYNPDNSVDVRYNIVDDNGNLWEQEFNYQECIHNEYGTLQVGQDCTMIFVDDEYYTWCAGRL